MATPPPSTVVLAALALSTISALAMFAAAAWTGSSALLAVAIQALIGAASQSLLLYGLRKTAGQPRGAGYEMYFWSFGVAVLLFSLGAGIAIYDGVAKLAAPLPNRYQHIAFTALAAGFVLTTAMVYLALKNLASAAPLARAALRGADDAAASTIVIEGLAGLLGLAIAAAGIVIARMLSAPAADGYAAITIGLVLGVVAAFMSLEIRTLLVRTGRAEHAPPAGFFIEDEPAPATADLSERPAAQPAIATTAPRAAPVSAPLASATPPPPARPMSRKERKRQKHKR